MGGFEPYIGKRSLEKRAGKLSMKSLKGVGVLSHRRILFRLMKGEVKDEQGLWGELRGWDH